MEVDLEVDPRSKGSDRMGGWAGVMTGGGSGLRCGFVAGSVCGCRSKETGKAEEGQRQVFEGAGRVR